MERRLVILKRLVFGVREIEFRVAEIENRRGVGRVIDGAAGLNLEFTAKPVVLHRIDDEREGAIDALIGSESRVGPFPVVDELVERVLKGLEDVLVRALDLITIDRQAGIQFGDLRRGHHGSEEGKNQE